MEKNDKEIKGVGTSHKPQPGQSYGGTPYGNSYRTDHFATPNNVELPF